MCQQGGENVDAFHFHRDPLVQYHMGNVINQLVFVEKVSEKISPGMCLNEYFKV